MKTNKKSLLLIAVLLFLSGCQTAKFYQQAIVGQTQLMLKRQQTQNLLVADETDLALKQRIRLVNSLLEFADGVGLPSNGAYSSYVETGQPFIIWNVFAAPALELRLEQSCFPIAGCVSYRGYFDRDDAMQYAKHLRSKGFDVYIGGVAAYSTLGWFQDPLLDTFMFRTEDELAALLFHELAHQLVYVKDDTRFNESMATTVEQYLLGKWLQREGEQGRFDQYLENQRQVRAVTKLIEKTRQALANIYSAESSDSAKMRAKEKHISAMVLHYKSLAENWGDSPPFERWMQTPINNAKLETVADYHQWVVPLVKIIEQEGFDRFVDEVHKLAEMPAEARQRRLALTQ